MRFLKETIFYLYKLGLQGLNISLGRKFGSKGKQLSIKPGQGHRRVFIRNKTSDLDCFNDLYFANPYKQIRKDKAQVIVDLGANIGLASAYFMKEHPGARLIAVEPEPGNFGQLKRNTAGLNVKLYQKGVWPRSGHLKIVPSSSGEWGFQVKETTEDDPDSIPAISISDIIKENNLDQIDILKIDIEGSEMQLFSEGTEQWLPLVKTIVIEFHDNKILGTSRPFFEAIRPYKYAISTSGENIICQLYGHNNE